MRIESTGRARETVPVAPGTRHGSTEIHAVPGYGAIQIGRHAFCHWEDGAQDCGVFGFAHLWRERDRWQITRVG